MKPEQILQLVKVGIHALLAVAKIITGLTPSVADDKVVEEVEKWVDTLFPM